MVLVVAATERELEHVTGAETLVCGVGPVEAGIRTARALAERAPEGVLHVGIAGARGLEPLALVLGSEARYEDADGPLVAAHAFPGAAMFDRAHRALPEAVVLPIGTSARVGGTRACEVEAMEGFAVLYACALAGVPAVELRVVSNAVDESDRAKWRFDEAFAALGGAVARVLA
ncbi:MAG: hypothetical protein JOZ56_00185 [Actinobacteria bacterium]|nr:hypothetical protein [Actinomycetota bacterium]